MKRFDSLDKLMIIGEYAFYRIEDNRYEICLFPEKHSLHNEADLNLILTTFAGWEYKVVKK